MRRPSVPKMVTVTIFVVTFFLLAGCGASQGLDVSGELPSFERYSSDCENSSPQDAVLHRALHRVAGQARALIEGAWSYRMQARVSPKLQVRLEALPKIVRDIAWKGQLRMCQRYRHLIAAGKAKVVATTAIAREMVGFIWDICRTVAPGSFPSAT